jgi:hypothetical protein
MASEVMAVVSVKTMTTGPGRAHDHQSNHEDQNTQNLKSLHGVSLGELTPREMTDDCAKQHGIARNGTRRLAKSQRNPYVCHPIAAIVQAAQGAPVGKSVIAHTDGLARQQHRSGLAREKHNTSTEGMLFHKGGPAEPAACMMQWANH